MIKIYLLILFCLTCSFSSDWVESFSEEGITVYKKNNHTGPIIPLMAKAQINTSVNVFMAVMAASDRRIEWIPMQKKAKLIKINDPFDRIEYSAVKVPWPFNDRDFVYRAITKIDKKEKLIHIEMQSVEYPTVDHTHVRGFMHDGSIIIKQITPQVYDMTVMFQSDPKGAIPNWLINMVQQKWPLNFIKNLRKQVVKVEAEKNYDYKDVDFFK